MSAQQRYSRSGVLDRATEWGEVDLTRIRQAVDVIMPRGATLHVIDGLLIERGLRSDSRLREHFAQKLIWVLESLWRDDEVTFSPRDWPFGDPVELLVTVNIDFWSSTFDELLAAQMLHPLHSEGRYPHGQLLELLSGFVPHVAI